MDQKRQRPKTATQRLSKEEIYDRNTTFTHVNKINRKLARAMKSGPYRPPDKATIRSQFSQIFSEKDLIKECCHINSQLQSLNITKGPFYQETHKNRIIRTNNIIEQELEKFNQKQQDL